MLLFCTSPKERLTQTALAVLTGVVRSLFLRPRHGEGWFAWLVFRKYAKYPFFLGESGSFLNRVAYFSKLMKNAPSLHIQYVLLPAASRYCHFHDPLGVEMKLTGCRGRVPPLPCLLSSGSCGLYLEALKVLHWDGGKEKICSQCCSFYMVLSLELSF